MGKPSKMGFSLGYDMVLMVFFYGDLTIKQGDLTKKHDGRMGYLWDVTEELGWMME